MVGAEHFLVDCERSLENLSRRRIVVVQVKHQSKVIEARSCMGMPGTQHFFVDRQRALME
jgi:hypothetical protein